MQLRLLGLGEMKSEVYGFSKKSKELCRLTMSVKLRLTASACWLVFADRYSKGDDPKKWKANFRCALHSLRRQIRFEASMSKSKGNSAFRMYRLLPVTTENQTGFRKRSSANRNKHVSEQSSSSSSGVESDEEQTESDFSSDPVQGEDDADIGLVADWIQSGELEIETIA